MATSLSDKCQFIPGSATFEIIDRRLARAVKTQEWNAGGLVVVNYTKFEMGSFEITNPLPGPAKSKPYVGQSVVYYIELDHDAAAGKQRHLTAQLSLDPGSKGLTTCVYICEYEHISLGKPGHYRTNVINIGWAISLECAIHELNHILIHNTYAKRAVPRGVACKKIGPIDRELTSKLLKAVGISAIGDHS